jgi:agmatine deiminase
MACKSSVISQKKGATRNKGITQEEAEECLKPITGYPK